MQKKNYFEKVLILTQQNENTSAERSLLRKLTLRDIDIYTSGLAFFKDFSHSTNIDLQCKHIIFCHHKLSDMSIIEFMKIVKLNPYFLHQPFVGVAHNTGEEEKMRDIGFVTILKKPMDFATLEKAVQQSQVYEQSRREKLQSLTQSKKIVLSTEKFDKELEQIKAHQKTSIKDLTAEGALKEGVAMLKKGNINKAISFLSKATVENKTAGQAFTVLAKIYGNQKNFQLEEKYLKKAIGVYAESFNYSKLYEITSLYKKRFPSKVHPFSSEVKKYLAAEKTSEVMEIFTRTSDIYPFSELMDTIVDGCVSCTDPLKIAHEFSDQLKFKEPALSKEIVPLVTGEIKIRQGDEKRRKAEEKRKMKMDKTGFSLFSSKKEENQEKIQAEVPVAIKQKKKKEHELAQLSEKTKIKEEKIEKTGKPDYMSVKGDPFKNRLVLENLDEISDSEYGKDPIKLKSMFWGIVFNTFLMYKKSKR